MDDLLEDATMGLKFNHLKCRANERDQHCRHACDGLIVLYRAKIKGNAIDRGKENDVCQL